MPSFFLFPLDKDTARQYNPKVPHGPVAQLGAHYIRIVGVVGSNPIRSTNRKTTHWVVFLLVWYSRIGFEKYRCNADEHCLPPA